MLCRTFDVQQLNTVEAWQSFRLMINVLIFHRPYIQVDTCYKFVGLVDTEPR